MGKGGKEGVEGVRDDQSYQIAFLGFQAPGVSIYFIVQGGNRFLHFQPVLFGNRDAVDHLGNGS